VVFIVLLHPKAANELEKTEKSMKPRIIEKVRELGDHPERVGKRLMHLGFWSLRIGDFSIIYEIVRDKE
jgi:mRNA-degrading endonuclease RelE of RelBE toxin-antitoxin system